MAETGKQGGIASGESRSKGKKNTPASNAQPRDNSRHTEAKVAKAVGMTLPAKLDPSAVVAIIDTREQTPLELSPLQTRRGTLATGDYALAAAPELVAIERKSESDLLGCIGRERERFDREVDRLLAYPVRALVVESTWGAMELGQWRGKVKPTQAVGSLLGWMAKGLPVVMAGNHQRAGQLVAKLLYIAARRRWRELRAMASTMEAGSN